MTVRKSFRCVVSLVLCFLLFLSSVLPTFAAEWNGNSAGGSTGGSVGATDGYAIHSTWFDSPGTVMALRFSYYNVNTGKTEGTTIDIYKDAYASGDTDYLSTHYKFGTKYYINIK